MNSIQTVALVPPELISVVPKKNESTGFVGCVKGVCNAVINAPFELKVLGVLGTICAIGGFSSLIGMGATSSQSKVDDLLFQQRKGGLKSALLTSEMTYITWSNHDPSNICDIDGINHSSTSETSYTRQTYTNTVTTDRESCQLMIGINDLANCKLRAVNFCRITNENGVIGYIDSDDVAVKDDCTLYDLTKMSNVNITVNGQTEKANPVPLDSMLNCIKADGTLADFLNDLVHMGKKIMESSSDKAGSTTQLLKLADEYEKHIPNVGIKDALTLYTEVYNKKTISEREATREALLVAGVALSSLAGLAFISSGIISFVSCLNSKVSVYYCMEGNSISITTGRNKKYLELYDPLFKNKASKEMVNACKHAMVYGAQLDEVYEMAIEVSDRIDRILGHNAVGTELIHNVQQWMSKHHPRDFKSYCNYVGIDFTPQGSVRSTSTV